MMRLFLFASLSLSYSLLAQTPLPIVPVTTGDLTNPRELTDAISPHVSTPMPLNPAVIGELQSGVQKLCEALEELDPLADPQLPVGLNQVGEPLVCWLKLKMLLAVACSNLEDKVNPLPPFGDADRAVGHYMSYGS